MFVYSTRVIIMIPWFVANVIFFFDVAKIYILINVAFQDNPYTACIAPRKTKYNHDSNIHQVFRCNTYTQQQGGLHVLVLVSGASAAVSHYE